jgi:hypothetical protein
MVYINIKEDNQVETIDEFETYKEAKEMLKEYRFVSNYYIGAYLSQRCTNYWSNR